jgi:hypothetical protein
MTVKSVTELQEALRKATNIQECLDIADTDLYFEGVGPSAIDKALSLVTREEEVWTIYEHTMMNSRESQTCIQKAKSFTD